MMPDDTRLGWISNINLYLHFHDSKHVIHALTSNQIVRRMKEKIQNLYNLYQHTKQMSSGDLGEPITVPASQRVRKANGGFNWALKRLSCRRSREAGRFGDGRLSDCPPLSLTGISLLWETRISLMDIFTPIKAKVTR